MNSYKAKNLKQEIIQNMNFIFPVRQTSHNHQGKSDALINQIGQVQTYLYTIECFYFEPKGCTRK